jgi:hypothetical protein
MTPDQVRATELGDIIEWLRQLDEQQFVNRMQGGDKPLYME